MSFFDRLLPSRVFSGKNSIGLWAELSLEGKVYTIHEFDWEFKQDLDWHQQPSSELYGGAMGITLQGNVDSTIHNWIMNPGRKHSGILKFYNNVETYSEGAVMEIEFEDAICARYHKQIIADGGLLSTTLVLSARVLKVGNQVFEQKWS